MTPREQANRDVLVHYRRLRVFEQTPESTLSILAATYSAAYATYADINPALSSHYRLRLEIVQYYRASLSWRPKYWVNGGDTTRKSWVQLSLTGAIRETGTGWPA